MGCCARPGLASAKVRKHVLTDEENDKKKPTIFGRKTVGNRSENGRQKVGLDGLMCRKWPVAGRFSPSTVDGRRWSAKKSFSGLAAVEKVLQLVHLFRKFGLGLRQIQWIAILVDKALWHQTLHVGYLHGVVGSERGQHAV